MEIIKIERTDKDVDNTVYYAKVPYTVTDDFGTEVTLYHKEEIDMASLQKEEAELTERLAKISEKIVKLEEAELE